MASTRKREGSEMAFAERNTGAAGQKSLNDYRDTVSNDDDERNQPQENDRTIEGTRTSAVCDAGMGQEPRLLLDSDINGCLRLLGNYDFYPCTGCSGAIILNECERIRGIKHGTNKR